LLPQAGEGTDATTEREEVMGYSYDRASGRLCCDRCGEDGGVRRRNCPAKYCPAWAICATCWKDGEVKSAWLAAHVDCPERMAEFEATRKVTA
jgi:hypothetical protein